MHELVAAGVDADVAHLPTREPEKHQVTGLQVATGDRRRGSELLRRRARHDDADLPERIAHQTAAVVCVGTRAAIAIRRADLGLGDAQHCRAAGRFVVAAGRFVVAAGARHQNGAVAGHAALERRAGGKQRERGTER